MGKKDIDCDVILNHIGQCGKWQIVNCAWLCLVSIAGGIAVVTWAFTAFAMDHRCVIPYCENAPDAVSFKLPDGNFPPFVLNKNDDPCSYMAVKDNTLANSIGCEAYLNLGNASLEQRKCRTENLVYDTSIVQSSLLKEYSLTCGSSVQAGFLGASYMLGLLIGSFCIGLLSDRFGRKKTLMISITLVAVCGSIGIFMPEAIGFGIFRCLTGIGGMGTFMLPFILVVESVGPKYTVLAGIFIELPCAIGEVVLGLEAYFIRDWKTLQAVAYGPVILLLLLWFVVPESPRWLLAVGKKEKALEILQNAAKVNKRIIPEHYLKEDTVIASANGISNQDDNKEDKRANLTDLIHPKIIAMRTVNMCYQWFSVTMCYYGLSFAATSLSGDPYTNFCLSVFMSIPGYIFCYLTMDCWGRRPILTFCQLMSGVSCILAGLLFGNADMAALQIILSLLGKFGATVSFANVYIYTAELFPTTIRSTAMGCCSTVARFGGMAALLIQQLTHIWGPLPMVIMGVSAVVAGCFAVFFPETTGHQLPETMDEAINLGKDSKRGLLTCIFPKKLKEVFIKEEKEPLNNLANI